MSIFYMSITMSICLYVYNLKMYRLMLWMARNRPMKIVPLTSYRRSLRSPPRYMLLQRGHYWIHYCAFAGATVTNCVAGSGAIFVCTMSAVFRKKLVLVAAGLVTLLVLTYTYTGSSKTLSKASTTYDTIQKAIVQSKNMFGVGGRKSEEQVG